MIVRQLNLNQHDVPEEKQGMTNKLYYMPIKFFYSIQPSLFNCTPLVLFHTLLSTNSMFEKKQSKSICAQLNANKNDISDGIRIWGLEN